MKKKEFNEWFKEFKSGQGACTAIMPSALAVLPFFYLGDN